MQLTLKGTVLALIIAVGGCATSTPYQPLDSETGVAGGYTNQRLAENRYRVTFAGNSMTSRETVEDYLLYRAADLTAQSGYDWFVMADRDVERDRRVVIDRPFHDGRWGYWGPMWRYRAASGWRIWDPYYGDPFWADRIDVRTVDRYEATAEIIIRRGSFRNGGPAAFSAQQVLANLGPDIQRPA